MGSEDSRNSTSFEYPLDEDPLGVHQTIDSY